MKKAFCEPGNTDFCPPIVVASTLSFGFDGQNAGTFVVKRSDENGGDVTYESRAEIEKDFSSGALHPGDLKASATTLMISTLEKIAIGIKNDNDATKAAKILKVFRKKVEKMDKK